MSSITKALFGCLVVLSLSACDKALLDVDFNYSPAAMEFTIDSTTEGEKIDLTTTIDNTQIDSVLKANKIDRNEVSSVKLTMITISPDSGSRVDIFRSVDAYLLATGLPEVLIAKSEFTTTLIEGGTTNITLSNADLLPYINKSAMVFKATAQPGATIKEKSKVKIMLRYTFKGKV